MGSTVDQGGRMEKRLPIAILVNLTNLDHASANGTEMTYTDNVSAHGACVVSSHSWQRGAVAEVTSLLDQIALRGKVVHCRKRGDGRYAIGLNFQNSQVVWRAYLRYNGAPVNNSAVPLFRAAKQQS
jgi:hypothetical protein